MNNTPMLQPKHLGLAREVMRAIIEDLPNVDLDPQQVKKWQLISLGQDTILLATLDINTPHPEKWEKQTHRIQTLVRSRVPWAKVAHVNSTGYRYAIRLSRQQPLPKLLPFPGVAAETILVGMSRSGQVQFSWATWDQHMIVAGMTRSGKSSFVRLLVHQAIAAGAQLMIADMKERTFLPFEKSPNLVRKIAMTPLAAGELIDQVLGEIEHRKAMFNELPGYHEKLSEYNQAAIKSGKPVLPRMIVVLDEFLFAINALGGVRGKFATKVWDIVRVGLAYGIHVVLTAQDIGKDDLGGLRDQFGIVICCRTKNADTARNLRVKPAADIPADHPGLAYCDPWGWVQLYHLDKLDLVKAAPGEGMTADERSLYDVASTWGWVLSRDRVRDALGVNDWQARKVHQQLAQRGWLIKDAAQNNAFVVSERWKSVAGDGWRGLEGVGGVGGWSETKPQAGEEDA
jgi:hypothetical protein